MTLGHSHRYPNEIVISIIIIIINIVQSGTSIGSRHSLCTLVVGCARALVPCSDERVAAELVARVARLEGMVRLAWGRRCRAMGPSGCHRATGGGHSGCR